LSVGFALLIAGSHCFAAATVIGDCAKGKTVSVIKKRSLVPPSPAASAASAPKAVKKKAKKKAVPAKEIEPCPPLNFPTPISFIPPPDTTTIPPDSPIMPQEVPPPLVMTVVPFGPECFCNTEEGGGGYFYGGYPVGGGGGFYVPQVPTLPPVPEPHEWMLFIAGLAGIAWRQRGRT